MTLPNIVAKIDALTRCPGCGGPIEQDAMILEYGRCMTCKFPAQCTSTTNGHRCTKKPGHDGDHRDAAFEWLAASDTDPEPTPLAPACTATYAYHKCMLNPGHTGEHESALGRRWIAGSLSAVPTSEAQTFVVTETDPAEPAAADHMPDAAGPTEPPVGADGAAEATEAPAAVQPRANGGIVNAGQAYLLTGNGCTHRIDIRRWLKRWFR